MTSRLRRVSHLGVLGMGLAAACASSSTPPTIATVTPAQAFNDVPVVLRIEVENLRPSLSVDVGQGALNTNLQSVRMTLHPQLPDVGPVVALDALDWTGNRTFWGRVPAGLAPGRYDLDLTGPDGKVTPIVDAFESLGPDNQPPDIRVDPPLAPDSIIGEGATKAFAIVADDGPGAVAQVHWETSDGRSGDCPPIELSATALAPNPLDMPPPQIRCPVSITIPRFADLDPSVQPFQLHAWARDVAGHESPLDIPLRIARRPTVVLFASTVGALGGYQPFMVKGRDFLPGSQVLLGGVPIVGQLPGGDRANDQLIVGWTPPRNRAGAVLVQVRSDAGLSDEVPPYFKYVAPPLPRDVQPNRGPSAGGVRITVRGNDLRRDAVVYIGATRETRQLLTYPHYDPSETKVDACLPPGSGTVSVWVYDATTGDGELPQAFTYDDPALGAAAVLDPGCR